MISIRQATEYDWPRIIEIYNQAVDDGYCTADMEHIDVASRRDWFTTHLQKEYPILVICQDDQVAG